MDKQKNQITKSSEKCFLPEVVLTRPSLEKGDSCEENV
jgi:hypothetical protein